MSDEHLHSAARALEGIMRDLDSEHVWVFEVGQHDGAHGHRPATTAVALDEPGAVTDHPHAVSDGPDDAHVNGNTLDNRRANLRACTNAQNGQNRHQCGPYRGAHWDARKKRWMAYATLAGKQRHLGYFATQADAAAAAAAFRRQHMPFSADARGALEGQA